MSLFTPDSPAGRAVRDLLRQHQEGLSIPPMRRRLRAFRLSEANIRELLAHPDFDGPDPQGRYTLRSLRQAGQVALGAAPPRTRKGPRAAMPPTLAHPPLGVGAGPTPTSYVVFDLETSGINPERGRILQLSALKISGGAPDPERAVFNRYADPGDMRIPYTLQLKLGLERDADGRLALPDAAPLREVLADFRAWSGELPLVAHNARFDYGFLDAACRAELGESIAWERLLDTMELACLALPTLPSLKLEDLAAHLEIKPGAPLGAQVERLARAGQVDFDWGRFHNAVVDVLVLAVVFGELQVRLREKLQPLAGWVRHLMPELADWLGDGGRGDPTPTGLPAPYSLARVRGPAGASPSIAGRRPLSALDCSPATVQAHFQALLASKGYPERPPQTQMVSHVAEAFGQGHFLAVEAPTGTGKTYAYLVPAILRARGLGRPVVVSTNTRNLQDQLMGDLRDLEQHLGLDFTFQPIKGMENYLCLERLGLFVEELEAAGQADDEERLGLLYFLSWLNATPSGALDDLSYWFQATFPSFGAILGEVKAEWERCDQAACPNREGCFFRHAYQKAAEADIVVVNHALLLSKKWEHTGLRFEYLVVDEAHNLEDVATNTLTREVSLDTLAYVLGRLYDPRTGRGLLVRLRRHLGGHAEGQRLLSAAFQEAAHASHLAGEFGGHLLNYLKARKVKIHEKYGAKLILQANPRRATPRLWEPVQAARYAMLDSLSELHHALAYLRHFLSGHPLPAEFHAPTLREMDYLLDRLDPRLPGSEPGLLDDILRVGYDGRVMVNWLEVEAEGEGNAADKSVFWTLKSAPVRVDRFLQEHLYRMHSDAGAADTRPAPTGSTSPAPARPSIVFTSATLRTTRDDNFGFFIDRLGLADYLADDQAVALPPTLCYERAIFGIPRYLRYDARQQDISKFAEEMARELGDFFEFTDGKGLVLYTARQRMEDAYAILEPHLSDVSIPVDYQAEGRSRRALADEFKARVESVLLGLRSFWEGFDAPGETLTYVVLEKLPFPMIAEPIIQARAAQVRASGGNEFFDYLLPLTFIHFKQGFGRLLRKESDLGAVLLMDKRVIRKSYYADMRAALPGPTFMDPDTERSRRAFYRRIAEHVNTLAETLPDPNARQAYRIDLDAKADFLESLDAEILLELERRLAALGIPDVVPESELDAWIERVIQAMREVFTEVVALREKQEEIIRQILLGRDVLAVLPTGSGKSLTFQLPALLRRGTTLVFSPLKALMKDQVDRLHSRGITLSDYIYSGQSADDQETVFRKIRQGTTRLVYISPERVRDPRLKEALRHARNIVQVVVDEAHCVHTWGQSFRPDFLHIPNILAEIPSRPETSRRPAVAAFTATATPAMQASIMQKLDLSVDQVISRNPNRPELRFVVYNGHTAGERVRSRRDKFTVLGKILHAADRDNQAAIVYCTTVREAEALTRRLDAAGFIVRCYHGRLGEAERVATQELFIEGDVNIIVATKAFGMGIDKPDVRYVIHYQVPGSLEDYYQEAGRAGRDGQVSYAVLLYHSSDLKVQEYFIEKAIPPDYLVEAVLDFIRRQAPAHGDTAHIALNPAHLADLLGDEAERLGLYLHLIESAGFVQRLDDITVQASTRLLVSREEVEERIRSQRGGSLGATFSALSLATGLSERTAIPLPVVEAGHQIGLAPQALDELLYWLAGEELIIYRPFERGFVLRSRPKLWDGSRFDAAAYDAGRIRQEMQIRLAEMQRYAERLGSGDCYRGAALAYFGASKPPTMKSECCNVCDPNLDLPWRDVTPVDFASLEEVMDARYVLLQAVHWNQSLESQAYRAPYGAHSLSYLLTGNRYMLVKNQDDPTKRARRVAQAESSPYFGALEFVPDKDKAIRAYLDELVDLNLVGYRVRQFEDGGSYHYPVLLPPGEERLRSGMRFDTGHG